MKEKRLLGDVTHDKTCKWACQRWAVAGTQFKWALVGLPWSAIGPRFGSKFGQSWAQNKIQYYGPWVKAQQKKLKIQQTIKNYEIKISS